MEIQRWATENPATLEVSDTLKAAIDTMHQRKIGAVLVVNNGSLAGVFTERDLINVVSVASYDESQPISEIMTKDPITAQVGDDYNVVYLLMKVNNIRHIPILDGTDLVGIVSIRDLTHFYQHKLETEFAEARDQVDELKRMVHLSTDEVLDKLFSEINRYKELSLTDHLTGLYNKRYFMRRLKEEVARAIRYGEEMSMIFSDIDHFKQVNDNYGHHVGDEVLRRIGAILAGGMGEFKVVSRLRKSDIIARYGGEEFVVILPETAPENAVVAAEKMRGAVEKERLEVGEIELNVTMSFGVAGVSADTTNEDDLVDRADFAMYKAKENGRNRVEIYNPETDSEFINPKRKR